jgi:hypothetical protein
VGIPWRSVLVAATLALATMLHLPARAITPDNPGPANVQMTVNTGTGVLPISPYIYGVNFYEDSGISAPAKLDRLGGNRWSAYNWETNASNAGKDYRYQNDNYLLWSQGILVNTPGAAVRPAIEDAAQDNRGLVVTVPMAGYVAADMNGTQIERSQFAPSSRFLEVVAKKPSPLSLTPDFGDGKVYTDEFVNWVEHTKSPNQQVFYSLDNEPALWGETLPANFQSSNWDNHLGNQPGRTHPEIHPYAPTYAEMRDKTIANASAIKDVNPNAIVFGGVGYGWAEFRDLQTASDRNSYPALNHPGGNTNGELDYLEWLLDRVHTEEVAQGRKLMDVLDVHWYPEVYASGVRVSDENSTSPSQAIIDARVQMTRSLWDTTYTEPNSWITGCCSGGPIKLLKHLQRDVQDFSPATGNIPVTKIAMTEYNYGGGQHISGGVAQADVLGIFGREGVFAASLWPLGGAMPYTNAAFNMYLNYDGQGGQFGDTSVSASTNVIADSAVYASVDSADTSQVIMVAINRTNVVKSAGIAVTADLRFDAAEVYQLTSSGPAPVRVADIPIDLVNAFIYSMPAYSVSTLVLKQFAPGDFDGDYVVGSADLAALKSNFGLASGAAYRQGDFDRDGDVDGADILGWQTTYGNFSGASASNGPVPEPTGLVPLLGCAALACHRRRAFANRKMPKQRDSA